MLRFLTNTVVGSLLLIPSAVTADEKVTYDEHVKPILRQKCFACHNPDKLSGDLDLTNYTGLMQGGGSGEVIEPGDSSSSYLYLLITHEEEPNMPPDSPKLPEDMLSTVRAWIDGGALENAASKANMAKKPGKTFTAAAVGERPAEVAFPGRLSLEPVVHTAHRNAVTAIATSPWAPLAAIGGQRQVLLYRTGPIEPVGVLPFPEGEIHVLKFSQDGALLLAGGGQGAAAGRVVVWDVRSGERVLDIGDELDTVLAADIRADLRQVALGGPGRVVRVFSTETGKVKHELRKHTEWIQSLAFSPDGVLLATADRNGGMFVWEAHSGREYLTLKGHGASITSLSWRSDSNVLASCSEDGTIRLWEMENGGQIKNWGAHGGGVACVEFSRDGRVISSGRDRLVKLWDGDGKELRAFDTFQDLALRASFCDETNTVVSGDWNGELRVWDATEGGLVGQLDLNPPPLNRRVELAQAALAEQEQAHQQVTTEADTAGEAHQQLLAEMEPAEQAVATSEQQLVSTQQVVTDAQQQIEQATASADQAAATIKLLEPVVPELNEAAARARAAADGLPNDTDLAAQATKLQETASRRGEELTQARQTQTATAELLPEKQKELAAAQSEAERLTSLRNAATQKRDEIREPLAAAQQQWDTAQKILADAKQKFDAASGELARWQGELHFAVQLAELRQARAAAMELWLESQTQIAELTAAAETVQQTVGEAETAVADAGSAVTQLSEQLSHTNAAIQTGQQQVEQMKKVQAATMEMVTREQQVIQLLQESAQAVRDALALTGDDETLSKALAKLNTTSEQHTARLAELRTNHDRLGESIQTTQNQVEENGKQADQLAVQLATTEQRAAESKSQLAVQHEQLAQTRQAADEVSHTGEQLLRDLEQARQRVRVAQGLEQPESSTQASAAAAQEANDSDG